MLRLAQSAASAFLFFALLSFAAAVVIAILLSFSQTQQNIHINGAIFESSSSFSSQVFNFLFRHHCCSYYFSCMLENHRQHSWACPCTHGISVQSICTLQSGLLSGGIFWSQPDLLLVSGQALGIIFRAELSRTVCTKRVMWHHCRSCDIVISLWLTHSLQTFASFSVRRSPVATQRTHLNDVTQLLLPGPGTLPICGSGLVTLGEFEIVLLRQNEAGIFLLPRAGDYQLVHCPGSKCSWRLYISWWGTAVFEVFPSGPSLCDCPASLSDVFLTWAACWVVASVKTFFQMHFV